ncbi:MAG: GIY-YIG nuclease family protein [Bacteroidales bacterium]|nr:GIY-YIG nuclease family protein [Bacteroidales bacterium]
MIITIQELLKANGLDPKAKIKLVRHKDARYDVYDMYRYNRPKFEEYQAFQGKPVFHNVDYIIVFIGEEANRARFVGIYKVAQEMTVDEIKRRITPEDNYYYVLEEIPGYEDLKERVIIRWNNPISWHQWFKNEMEVIEINAGFGKRPFTGYMDFILSFEELSELVNEDNDEWKRMLSNVYGVYVIRDTNTEKLYIGSAYGKEGIWQRWTTYVKTGGHGGNKTLKELVSKDSNYSKNFAFSLLVIMSKNTTDEAVIAQEQLLKRKLGAELCNN